MNFRLIPIAAALLINASPTLAFPGQTRTASPKAIQRPIGNAKQAAASAPFTQDAVKTANQVIREDFLRNYLTFIASDALAGRDTPSQGLDVAAEFLAFHLRAWGFQPAGDSGTFFQRIALVRSRIDRDGLSASLGSSPLEPGKDWFVGFLPGGGNARGSAEGNCVYVGHGWQAKGAGVDPYQGLDVRGKVLVVNGAQPEGLVTDTTPGKEVLPPAMVAGRMGAVGIVELNFGSPETFLSRGRAREAMGERRGMTPMAPDDVKDSAPIISLSPQQSASLLAGSPLTLETVAEEARIRKTAKGFALPDATRIRFTVTRQATVQWTRNVVAVWPGADPKLRGEYVAIGAHYDHVGYGTAATSYGPFGFVHNGADDNASGVAGLLEIAEALQRLPDRPRRTILLAFWDGEEKGLLGSTHFLRVRPAGVAVCSVNMDMIGRLRGGRLEVYGSRTAIGLREAVVLANSRGSTGAGLDLVFVWDIEEDSDHFPFIAASVPTVMFHTGLHDNYHRPSDDTHLANFPGIEPVARLALGFVLTVADDPEPLPGFRPACRGESNATRNRIEAAVPESPESPGGRWGIGTRDDPGEPGSPVVVRVWRSSAAERGGLRVGDRILAIDAARIVSQDDMVGRLRLAAATVALDVERRGRVEHLQLDAGTAHEKGPLTGP